MSDRMSVAGDHSKKVIVLAVADRCKIKELYHGRVRLDDPSLRLEAEFVVIAMFLLSHAATSPEANNDEACCNIQSFFDAKD